MKEGDNCGQVPAVKFFSALSELKTMKTLLIFGVFLPFSLFATTGVKGIVTSSAGCSSPVMVWLALDKENYNERLLLMHTEVPVGGSFQFYLKPGNYQIRGSDEKGCEFSQRLRIGQNLEDVQVKLVKK